MKSVLLGAVASVLVFAAGAAQAAISASVWVDQPGVAANATFAGLAALGAANASTTLPQLNFSTGNSTITTVDQFLGSSIGGAVGGHILNQTVFLFSGTLLLNAGNNAFVVPHDDGLQLNIDGIGLVVNQPGPTAEVNTPFNVNVGSAGTYNWQMVYGETAGGPAVIRFIVNDAPVTGGPSGVPEPATWAMMILGFGGLGLVMRRRRARPALAA